MESYFYGLPEVNDTCVIVGATEPTEVQDSSKLDDAGGNLMRIAVKQMGPSAREYHRVLKMVGSVAKSFDLK